MLDQVEKACREETLQLICQRWKIEFYGIDPRPNEMGAEFMAALVGGFFWGEMKNKISRKNYKI